MEKTNHMHTWKFEPKYSNQVSSYFQRAGSLGHLAITLVFYLVVFSMYWFIWRAA